MSLWARILAVIDWDVAHFRSAITIVAAVIPTALISVLIGPYDSETAPLFWVAMAWGAIVMVIMGWRHMRHGIREMRRLKELAEIERIAEEHSSRGRA